MATQADRAGVTVVPAHRVVGQFVRRARNLPTPESALEHLRESLRAYMRHTLTGLKAPYPEVAERSTLAQLGEADFDALEQAIAQADAAHAKESVESALARCETMLPVPGLNARMVLLPGNGTSRALTDILRGAGGISLADEVTVLYFWPVGDWLPWLGYAAAHEYTHLVRNHLFPRGFVGTQLVYVDTGQPENLLDAIVAEGIGDVFARELYPELAPPWLSALSDESAEKLWPDIRAHLQVDDPAEIRRFIYGDGARIPAWAGHCFGFRIAAAYLKEHPEIQPAALVSMAAATLFKGTSWAKGVPV